jgi:hypothetical protein
MEILQTPFYRRGAEDTEAVQRPDARTLRRLCVLGVSAVNPDLKVYQTTRHLETPEQAL